MGEFFDSGARFTSAVNRINSRLKTIGNRIGKLSRTYQKYSAEISANIPFEYQRFSNGILQIGKPKRLYNEGDLDIEKFISITDTDMETYGDIKNEYLPKYEQLKQKFEEENAQGFGDVATGEDFTLDEFIRANEELDNSLPVLYDNIKSDEVNEALDVMHITGRRKTYKELNGVIDVAELYTI